MTQWEFHTTSLTPLLCPHKVQLRPTCNVRERIFTWLLICTFRSVTLLSCTQFDPLTNNDFQSIPIRDCPLFLLGPIQTGEETRHTSTGPHAGLSHTGPHAPIAQPSAGSGDSHPSSPRYQHSQVLLPPWASCAGPRSQPRRSHCYHRERLHRV